MRLVLVFAILYTYCIISNAQVTKKENPERRTFRAAPEKINDMVHTKLMAEFDYQKSELNGKVWLTLKPHFYDVDSVQLDAKGMAIHKVQMVGIEKNSPLQFRYDSSYLTIRLGRKFSAKENYTLYIEYTARPNKIKSKGSEAIQEAKGLYFIDPIEQDAEKPTQIWTQGETESNSVWIPIIDKPNQKSTQEMILTVPDKYVSLSNGILTSQKKNANGTRTDIWKMDLPHAPYLFFIGIGDYAVIKDNYKGKEVSYYVEKSYANVARKIFGDTPKMMEFYSQKLGIDFPWPKYAQMIARDYVSGAMENTTATLHGEWAQQNARQLKDGNNWESTIAHELFHQWFGDYVTCESWSNLTVNESFADFGELMWMEHKYGKDEGQAFRYNSSRVYLLSAADSSKTLVRHYYEDKEDVFDNVSYQKGGAILNMLRSFVGEVAFYQSLNIYLTRNSFGTGNARELQQAFEDVTGKDLNWFFTQWYFGPGHPKLEITYHYDDATKSAFVYSKQKQQSQLFKLPLYIDVYEGTKSNRFFRWIENAADTFVFKVNKKPDLINVDAEKNLLVTKVDRKSLDEFIHQYKYAGNYIDRREAVEFASTIIKESEAANFMRIALQDKNYRIRLLALQALSAIPLDQSTLQIIESMAIDEPVKIVKARALSTLAKQDGLKYKHFLITNLNDSSYTVAGTALSCLIDIDEATALSWYPKLKNDAKGTLEAALKKAEMLTKTDDDFDEIYTSLSNSTLNFKYQNLSGFILYLRQVSNTTNFKKGISLVLKIRDEVIPYLPNFKSTLDKELITLKNSKLKKQEQGLLSKEIDIQIDLINSALK